ncbi:Ig-like domain-containing protein [Rhodococcus spelaei]|nr:Ig-like domain-containing protein [Rhodococcus spelaei]
MSGMSVRRVVAATGALAVAAGFAVTMGAGAAVAAPGTITWADGAVNFSRTVSNTAPLEGEVVTVTTTVAGANTVNWFEDDHPTCMNYVAGSATVAGIPVALQSQGAGTLRVAGSWPVDATNSPTFSFQYQVGANCPRAAALNSGIQYNGAAASGAYLNQGPAFIVPKNVTTTTLAPVGVLQGGVKSTLKANVLGGRAGDLVQFFAGTNKIGQGSLDANGATSVDWTPASTDAGSHDFTATFLETPFSATSTSAVQTATVAPGNMTTQTTLIIPTTSQTNVDVSLQAQVSPFPGAGTVTFKNGMTVLGTGTVGADGKASVVQNFNVAGDKSITAEFSGAPGYAASTSNVQTLSITTPGATDVATTITFNVPAVAQKGSAIFLTANVAPKAQGGTLQFFSGPEPLGNPVTVTGGVANQTYTFTVNGPVDIRAVYTGAPGYLASEATTTITVADSVPSTGGGTGSASGLGGLFGSS